MTQTLIRSYVTNQNSCARGATREALERIGAVIKEGATDSQLATAAYCEMLRILQEKTQDAVSEDLVIAAMVASKPPRGKTRGINGYNKVA
jgi:hypothetical protein